MEGLRKLEQVQRTILLMQSRGIINSSNNNADSDRFLANFILLLLQPCGVLDMDTKCQLISEHLANISVVFLEEALLLLGVEGNAQIENAAPLHCDDKAGCSVLQTDSEDMALVGLDAMQRANSTLEDFCRSYFMFHEMDVTQPQSIFRYLPMLSFTESYIYQLDRLNEKLPYFSTSGGFPVLERGSDVMQEANRSWSVKFVELFRTNPFGPLVVPLAHHGLLTERSNLLLTFFLEGKKGAKACPLSLVILSVLYGFRIREEFRSGEEYWALERKLCCSLTSKKEISLEDVMRAIHLKSFDFRVLNLLLYQLRGEKVNELHMEFLSVSEFLVEVSDDLFDYEDDVLENNFNILRMFVGIYGASTAPAMLAKCITDDEEKYEHLLKSLDSKLSMNYQKRCEEATKEGGKIIGPSLGTWSIPPVIEDEDLYRSEFINSKSSVVPPG
ncbi:hypothetical protein F0562_003216 [Nyssa sinensis]|uniref:Uncharacterized protein n=1 Tax=Nyssa sinensis TaxID=561372 RepID=A0A5J5BYJ8_9ASTE|nr:hypothetical protein F0562_003216 [Nyssa sinensis]